METLVIDLTKTKTKTICSCSIHCEKIGTDRDIIQTKKGKTFYYL